MELIWLKIVEFQKKQSECNSLLDWFRMENDLNINRFFLQAFFDYGGYVKNKNEIEICFILDYKGVTYNFYVTNFYMIFFINSVKVGVYRFLDECK